MPYFSHRLKWPLAVFVMVTAAIALDIKIPMGTVRVEVTDAWTGTDRVRVPRDSPSAQFSYVEFLGNDGITYRVYNERGRAALLSLTGTVTLNRYRRLLSGEYVYALR